MGYPHTHFAAATAAVTNRLVTSTDMKAGAYTVANAGAMPSAGARHVTVTRTVVGGTADTPGKITVTGKSISGHAITEDIVPGANGVLVAGAKWFASVDGIAGSGWAIDTGGTPAADTIIVGCGAEVIVVEGPGELHSIVINTTAAGAITVSDASGTIAVLKASLAEGNYVLDADFTGYLQVALAAASDVTVLARSSLPRHALA
jgi:hypothetical protein